MAHVGFWNRHDAGEFKKLIDVHGTGDITPLGTPLLDLADIRFTGLHHQSRLNGGTVVIAEAGSVVWCWTPWPTWRAGCRADPGTMSRTDDRLRYRGMSTDTRVDDYIAGLPEWQQDICREVRELVHEADPDVEETIKFTNRPYFVLDGNICALLGTKDHVNVFLYDKASVPDPENVITSGHGNKTARMISVYRDQPINGPALVEMFRHIIANNRRRRSVRPRR